MQSARHLFLHPGAYMKPRVLAGTEAYGKLAGVKGLWMRIKNAQELFGPQAPRPNKIHGGRYEVKVRGRTWRGQLTDLNIMLRLHPDGSWELAIGSGYLFVGLYPFEGDGDVCEALPDAASERQRQERVQLAHELAVEAFAQVVARTYDLDIDVDAVLVGKDSRIDIPSKGCIRSWTPDDRELRTLLPTSSGGVAIVHGGGNTGTATKSLFIGTVDATFARSLDVSPPVDSGVLAERYEALRASLRRTREDLPAGRWQALEEGLNEAIASARSPRKTAAKVA
jgi:hypothetical protein